VLPFYFAFSLYCVHFALQCCAVLHLQLNALYLIRVKCCWTRWLLPRRLYILCIEYITSLIVTKYRKQHYSMIFVVTVFLWPRSGLNLTSYRNMKKIRIPIAYTQPGLFTSCCLLYALRIKMGRTSKVVVCGQAAVGKTAILEQLINGDHVVGSVSLKFYFRVCYSINDPAFCPSRPMLTRGLINKTS